MAHETYRFEFVDGTAELVAHGSVRYHELLGDGHTPVGSVPESDGISDALEAWVDGRFGASSAQVAAAIETDPTVDTALAGKVTTGETGAALSATYAAWDHDPTQPLDLWEGFDSAGGGTSWAAGTYADYLAGIKVLFSGQIASGAVVETDRGACSNGTDHIWSYRAGRGPLRVLMVSGLHGDEILGDFLGLRWFETFATSQHPAMRYLRSRLTVEWVACANPHNYNTGKENANGVNLNRNFGFYWPGRQSPATAGSAPFSEVETQVIRTIVDEGNVVVIDLHGRGPVGSNSIGYAPASWLTLSNRDVVFSALNTWARSYADLGGGYDELLLVDEPVCNNWASFYKRWDDAAALPSAGVRRANQALLFEIASDQHGSTAFAMSDDAARQCCGFLTVYLGTILAHGLTEPTPVPSLTRATGPKTADGTSVVDGGNRMMSSTQGALHWGAISPATDGSAASVIRVVTPYPAQIKVTVEGYARYASAAGGTTFSGTVGISMDDDTGPDASSAETFTVESTDGNRETGFACSMLYNDTVPDGETIHEIRVWFQRNTGGSADIILCRAFVDVIPNYDAHPHPSVPQVVA